MSERLTLSIPKPCHERWSTFTQTEKGGFCASCQTEVIDFTQWSDEQIRQYVINKPKACGRFRPDQLKTYYTPQAAKTSWMPLSALLVPLLFTAVQTQAQTTESTSGNYPTQDDDLPVAAPTRNETPPSRPKGPGIRGTIRYEDDGTPIAGVSITSKLTNKVYHSDVYGNFSLPVIKDQPNDTLVVRYLGCQTQEYTVSADQEIDICLAPDIVTLGGYTVETIRPWSPRRIWRKIKNIF